MWLATHLLTALFTFAGMIWTALDLRALDRDRAAKPARLTAIGAITGVVLFVQLFYGALMAGLRAGVVSNSWPLMNGSFFPGETEPRPLLAALIDDPAIVHFIHRWWAWVVVVALVVLARVAKSSDRTASRAIHIAFGTQILLGIATVMTDVNVTLAALHQLTGALLVAATAWGAHSAGRAAR